MTGLELLLNIVLLVLGFAALIKGADWFVDGSAALARTFRVPGVIIGLTIVAMGTSAPELAVSTSAALQGANEIALSNVTGSNIFNLLMVLGVCALIRPIPIERGILKRDFPLSIAAAVAVLAAVGLPMLTGAVKLPVGMAENVGVISRGFGIALLVVFAAYLTLLIILGKKNKTAESDEPPVPVVKSVLLIVFGVACIIIGGQLVVNNAVAIAPSYGMYSVCAGINDVECRQIQLEEDFTLPVDALLDASDSGTKLMFLCSPNNPTGNAFPESGIRRLLDEFKGVLVLDEAYVDFSEQGSMVGLLEEYPNLIILQTLSKAYGMAGLRVGMALADPAIVSLFDKVRYPYNIGTDTLRLAVGSINPEKVASEIQMIRAQRDMVASRLAGFRCVEKIFPSDANFLLVKVSDPIALYSHLLRDGIIVRNRSSVTGCEGCLRLTVGTPEENNKMLRSIGAFENPGAIDYAPVQEGRRACRERVTRETKVLVEADLDGNGESSISTGLRFFDHMLEQIPHHSGISLKIIAEGDLDVDEHHTMEDVAITLGETLLEALGDRRGIERYGFALPMDECDAFVTMDLGGRIDFKCHIDDVPIYSIGADSGLIAIKSVKQRI